MDSDAHRLIPLAVFLMAAPAAADTFTYGCNKERNVIEVNLTTHTARIAGRLSFKTTACEWDATTGRLYYWRAEAQGANAFAYWVPGGSNGKSTTISSSLPTTILKQMAFAPDGTLYASSFDYYLYTINKAAGMPTLLGLITGLEPRRTGYQLTGDLAFDENGDCWLVTYQSVYRLDLATRVATLVHGPQMLDPDGPGPLQAPQVAWTGASWHEGQLIVSERNKTSYGSIRAIDPVSGAISYLLAMPAGANDLTAAFDR